MNMNNFDQSSTGLNLEVTCFYDGTRAQSDFRESFIECKDSYIFTEYGNVDGSLFEFDEWSNYRFTKAELSKQILSYFDRNEVLETARTYFDKSFYKLNKAELQELVEEICYDSAQVIEFQDNLTPLFDTIKTIGYCQGDVADIIITPAYKQWYKENAGKVWSKDDAGFKKMIHNLFWDQPIYAMLTINGERETGLEDFLKDDYQWDKDQLIHNFKTSQTDMFHKTSDCRFELFEINAIVDFLTEALPEQLEYQ